MSLCLRDYGFSEYSLRWLREHHLHTVSDITCLSFKDFKNLFKKVRKERFLYEKKSLTEIEDIIAEKTRIKISHQIISKKEIKISVVSVILN